MALAPPQKCFGFSVTMENNSSFLHLANDEWDTCGLASLRGRVDNEIPKAESSIAPESRERIQDCKCRSVTKISSKPSLLLMVVF